MACPAREAIAFIDDEGHAWTRPAAGRGLYQNIAGRWVHLGDAAFKCKCGAINRQREDGTGLDACQLCGAPRQSARAR